MSQSPLQRPCAGPASMPPSRSTRAPHYSGSVDESIEDFLREYEEFADSCRLTNLQKVETVTRYTTLDLRDFWKSLDGYVASDWRELKRELLKLYAGPSVLRRHSEQKLRDFARASAKSRMRSEADVVRYYRKFIVLCKPLIDSQRLTAGACDKIFWRGFHKRDRVEMYTRLIAGHPRQPMGVYFDYLDVYKMARAILGSHDLDSSESDDSWDEPHSARSWRSERIQEHWYDREERNPRVADPSNRTYEHRRLLSPIDHSPRDSRHRHFDTHHTSQPEAEAKDVHVKAPNREEEDCGAEDLMKHMRGLSAHEESYWGLFGRLALRFPSAAQNLPKPIFPQHMATSQAVPAPAAPFSIQVSMPPPPPAHRPLPVDPPGDVRRVTGLRSPRSPQHSHSWSSEPSGTSSLRSPSLRFELSRSGSLDSE